MLPRHLDKVHKQLNWKLIIHKCTYVHTMYPMKTLKIRLWKNVLTRWQKKLNYLYYFTLCSYKTVFIRPFKQLFLKNLSMNSLFVDFIKFDSWQSDAIVVIRRHIILSGHLPFFSFRLCTFMYVLQIWNSSPEFVSPFYRKKTDGFD
jgi:hypothetical protein